MANWDQDIHRIQEIQQLLENRQRYFRGHFSNAHYKLDPDGNPLFFPKLRSIGKKVESEDNSVGHSLKANFGSTDSESNGLPKDIVNKDSGSKNGESGSLSDSNDGNCADHSQNETSDASSEENKDSKKKKVVRKTARTLRKWVSKHLEEASTTTTTFNSKLTNASSMERSTSRKPSSVLRFKSVSFDNEDGEAESEPNKQTFEELLHIPKITKSSKKKRVSNPINLLRHRSWILKAEMASRLNEDVSQLNLNQVINSLSKTSISQAREKLKKAEKSLKSTVKNEHKMPIFRQHVSTTPTKSESRISPSGQKIKPLRQHTTVSRLALRQQEDAVRSDINLREAFALIKIDPDPLLQLAVPENMIKPSPSRQNVDDKKLSEPRIHRKFALDDSKTVQSLQILTKLSIQHLQKQQSFIPTSAVSLPTQTKQIKKTVSRRKFKPQLKDLNESSPTTKISSIIMNNQYRLPSKDKDDSGLNLAPSLSGKAAVATHERKSHFDRPLLCAHSLDRLSGTVI